MGFTGTALLLVLLSIYTNAARTTQNSNPCSMKCSQTEDSLFKTGQTYTYSYQGESNMKTANGIYDSTGIMIKSKIKVTGLSNCEMKISMTEVEVLDRLSKYGNTFKKSPNGEKMKTILEQNEVFFTRENELVKSVCMNKDEPIWSENIKKVIIDNLANQKYQEQHVAPRITSHGTCLEKRPNLSDSNSMTVTYDIGSCQNKKISQSIFGELTKIGLFHKAKVTCVREYQGITSLKTVKCTEEYRITQLKQNSNQISVEIKLILAKESQVKTNDKTFSDNNLFQTGIEQSEDDFLPEESAYTSAKSVLKEICEQQVDSVFSTIPKLFMKLINFLKILNTKEFKELYLDVVNGNICPMKHSDFKSLFYDATGFVNTPAATSVMVDLIKSNEISVYDQNLWLTSLSFMQQIPTVEMLKDLETLMSTETLNTPMYLGISAVTHLFCKANYEYCLNDRTIQNIISKFLKNLNNDCSLPKDFNQDHLSKVQISLKALGNLKVFSNEVTAVLNKCVSTATNPVSVRISALEVMKYMGCEKNRQVATDILENNENDSELRINAYLTVMGCPDTNALFKVRKILEKEQVNQVGSFIWTHLTNIKESKDILKTNIKELLDDVTLKKVFDISKLKFSRNIEKTFSTNKLGMTFDSNVIFSEKSFIPRSVSLNTTAMILDKPINFIEMSARLEGLEDLLYKLFGPQGYLKKANNIEDNLDLIKMLNEINGNMNLKLYGQQVSFIELARGSLGSIKKYNIIEELLSWTSDRSIEINKNLQLLDKSVVFPTMLGFPLQFKLQSSTSVNIKIKSKLDVSGLFTWPIKMNIKNHISPNINAELNADLVLQSPFTKYGMKLNLKSGTNTEFKASIHTSNNEEFSIKFDTPKWRQNILSVEGNSYVIHRNEELVQLQEKLVKNELCTSELVTNIFGVKACGELKWVSSEFRKDTPLFGPFSANIFIEKQDSQTGYVFQGSSRIIPYIAENGAIYSSRFIRLEFNTPNTEIYDRKYYGEFSLDYKKSYAKFELRTPWNQFSIMNTYRLTTDEKKIGLNIKLNYKDVVDLSGEFMRFFTPKGMNLKSKVSVSILKFKPYTTKWSLDMSSKQFVFNFQSSGLLKDDTKINLKIEKVESTRELSLFNKYTISGFYNSYFGNGKISGIANDNYYGHRWDVKINHKPRVKSQNELNFIFRHKIENKSSKNLMKYFLTTTFAYGKNAENFIKLKTENEMSTKHVRTSIKVSYGQNEDGSGKLFEEIDLKLYGGYTRKDQGQYYQEGSLSFKFPSKNLHYEGRYNAEIGSRMFKMLLALDKGQQSQLNLKVNYAQPELYLKNTDCEIIFSIPQNNLDVKWNLVEVDVNKYKYSLEGQYNNFDLRIDGVQTQISRLNHDSSLTIKMTHATFLPKQTNINFKINLVDLSKSTIYGKIEFPESNFKYSMETQFSYTPQNIFQISSSGISSVIMYDMKLSSIQKTVKSKFIFTCNPEEFQTYFQLNMDQNEDSDKQIEFNVHALHKKPNYKLIENMALIMIRYPGNQHSLGFKSEFKYTEMMAQIDILWNRDRKISISTMYELDNSWTQKGLKGSLTIKTPFTGYTFTHFGVNAVGQLRYRKVAFEYKWGANKKIFFDIILEPKSSNDFTFSWKLVTPYKGITLVSFNAKHLTTGKSINTEANLEIGPSNRYQIKFEAVDNSEGKTRDYKANILIESGIYPPIKISAIHKDDSVHFKTKFEAGWQNTESLIIKSDVSYTREEYDIACKGDVELLSTLYQATQMKATWLIENHDSQFVNNIQILHNSKNIFNSALKGFYESEPKIFKLDCSGEATLLQERTVKIANILQYKSGNSINHRFSLSKDSGSLYSHNFIFEQNLISLKVHIPNVQYPTMEFSRIEKCQGNQCNVKTIWKIDENNFFNSEQERKILDNKVEYNFNAKIRSEYLKVTNGEIQLKLLHNQYDYTLESEITMDSKSLVKLSVEVDRSVKCKLSMKTKYKSLRTFNLNFELLENRKDRSITNNLGFSLNDDLTFIGNLHFRQFRYINADFRLKRRTMEKYVKFQYNSHLMGYEQSFETNIFRRKIKLVSSSKSRGGFEVDAKLENFWLFNTLEVHGKFSRETQITIIYQQSDLLGSNEMVKLFYSNSKGVQELSLESSSYFNGRIKLDLLEFKTILLVFKTKVPESELEFQLNYNGGKDAMKHSSQIILISGRDKYEFKNKLEKVKWKYLLIESELNTNWEELQMFKVGFEYNVRPNKFSLDVNGVLNKRFMKLSTSLEQGVHTQVEMKIETSFAVLTEINYSMKSKYNKNLTQGKHHCKTIVKSYGDEFQLENEVEWSGLNYVKIESSFVGTPSGIVYFSEPKSLKFLHRIYQNTLKDSLEIQLGKDKNLKLNIVMPFTSKAKMVFEFESFYEHVKKLSAEFDIDSTKARENICAVTLRKNDKQVLFLRVHYKVKPKLFFLSSNLELYKTHKTNFELNFNDYPMDNYRLQFTFFNSPMKEPINFDATLNLQKSKFSMLIDGELNEEISTQMEFSSYKVFTKVKYGQHVLLVDIRNEMTKFVKVEITSVFQTKFEYSQSPEDIKLSGSFEQNSLAIGYKFSRELNVDAKVLEKSLSFVLKQINILKWTFHGESNFKDWSVFSSELEIISSSKNLQVKTFFKREQKELMSVLCQVKSGKSLTFLYTSSYEFLKSANFKLNYENEPVVGSLEMKGEMLGPQFFICKYQLGKTSFKVKIESSFEWIKKVNIQGTIKSENNEFKGKFSIEHNKMLEPINGAFTLNIKKDSVKLEVKTPLAYPYNEMSFTKQITQSSILIELATKEKKLFLCQIKRSDNFLYEADIDVLIPRSTQDFTLTLKSTIDIGSPTKSLKLLWKSNLFKESQLEIFVNFLNDKLKVKYSGSSKEIILDLGVSPFQTSGRKVELIVQHGDDKNSAEVFYDLWTIHNVYLETRVKLSSFVSTPLNFETKYEHKVNFPQRFYLNAKSKVNDKTVFLETINLQRQQDSSIDLLGKLILSPYEKEYENKIEMSYKHREKFSLTISSPEILREEIKIQVTIKPDTIDISCKSPFELVKSVELNIRMEQNQKSWTQAITFNTNKLGKYEMISEYKLLASMESQFTSQINTPSTNRNVYVEMNFKHTLREQLLKSELVFGEHVLNFQYVLKNNYFSLKLLTPFEIVKRCELVAKSQSSVFEAEILYNHHKLSSMYTQTSKMVSLKVQSNLDQFKTMSTSIRVSKPSDLENLVDIELTKDDQRLKMGFQTNEKKTSLMCTVENDLVYFIPKQFSWKFQYSFTPVDIDINLKLNDVPFFMFIVNKEQFLFNMKATVFKRSVTETKFHLSKNRIELIVLLESTFSVLITRTSLNQIDAVAIINENQYSLRAKYEITKDALNLKLSIYRNAVDELLDISSRIGKYDQSIDVEVKRLSKTVLKLRLEDSDILNKISLEAKILSFNGVADWTMKRKYGILDAKISWNVLYNDQQLLLGSVELVGEYDRPLKFLLNINLQQMVFQAKLMESDNGEFTLELNCPYKSFDTIFKWKYLNKPNEYELWCSLNSNFIGVYSTNMKVNLNRNPELKFMFSSASPIINYNLKMIMSQPNEFNVEMDFRFLDWEKIAFTGTISTKDLLELRVALQTPFSLIKHVEVKKTINYISLFEQKYEMTIIYNGYKKFQYTGGHEIYWSRNIVKFQQSFYREDVRIISVSIDHSGNHRQLDHTHIWYIRDRKFGFKLNGGFNPLFEGKSEIYTPFHKTGKIVVMGKQMETGVLIEAGKNDEALGSFEYLSEKDMKSMRITPPSYYGKPLLVKYRSRRSRRSVSDNTDTDIMYGMDNLLKLSTKIQMKEDKYVGFLNIAAPKFTTKSAELSVNHYYEAGAWNFDHNLKIKDSVDKLYRIFGKLFTENAKNFQITLNGNHPDLGQMHLAMGHTLTKESYVNHFLIKSGDQTILKYNNNIKFDFIKSSFTGEWVTKIYSHHYQINAIHDGEWNEFKQNVIVVYNRSPLWLYKGHVVRKQRSVIEMEIPRLDSSKMVVTFDRLKNQAAISWESKSVNGVVDITNQNGQLLTSFKRDNENIASLLVRYNQQPMYAKANYLQHSGSMEMDFKDSLVSLKADCTLMKLKNAMMKISKNEITYQANYYDELYHVNAKYEYLPDNFNFIFKSSMKEISSLSFQAVPNQWTLKINDYYQTVQYTIKPNHVRLQGENNFFKLKTLIFDLKFQPNEKANLELQLNSFISKTKLENKEKEIRFHSENNYFSPKSLELKLVREMKPNLKYYKIVLSADKDEKLKLQWEVKNQEYIFGMTTFLGLSMVVSFDQKSNKMIASLRNEENHLNIIFHLKKDAVQSSKTYGYEASVDSSFAILRKLTNNLSFTITADGYDVQSESAYNGRHLQLNGKLSTSKVFFYIKTGETIYQFTAILESANNLVMEIVIPNHKMKVELKREKNQYLLDIKCNKKDILIVRVNQDLTSKYNFVHKSHIEYYGRPVWDISFNSNFQKYEIKMNIPIKMNASVTIDWKESEETTFGFLLQFPHKIVLGAGIKYLFTSKSSSYEVYIENYLRIISLRKETELTTRKLIVLKGINKNTKDQWELKVQLIKEKSLEIYWKTPTSLKEIKYNQVIENNVQTKMELEVSGIGKIHLALTKPDLWKGYLTLFSERVASIEIGKNYANAIINEAAAENDRIILKYMISTNGEWKKNYKSVKQLVVIQKTLNIDLDLYSETIMESRFYSTFTKVKYQMIDGKVRNLKLGASIDFTKYNKVTIKVENPYLPIQTVLYQFQPDKVTLRYEMRTILGEKDKIDGYFELKTGSIPGMTAKLHYNPSDPTEFFQIHSKYTDDRQLDTSVFFVKKEIRTTYFQFQMTLLNEHHIKTVFSIRKQMLSDIFTFILEGTEGSLNELNKNVDLELRQIADELHTRQTQIFNKIPSVKKLNKVLEVYFDEIMKEILRVLKNDEFYIDSIIRVCIETSFIAARVGYFLTLELVKIVERIPPQIFEFVRHIVSLITDLYRCLSYRTYYYVSRFLSLYERFLNLISMTYLPEIYKNSISIMEDVISFSKRFYMNAITLTRSTKRLINTFFFKSTYILLGRFTEIIKSTIGKLEEGSLDFLKYEEEIKVLYRNFILKMESILNGLTEKLMFVAMEADDRLGLVMGDNYFQNWGQVFTMISDEFIQYLKSQNTQNIIYNAVSSSMKTSLYELNGNIQKFATKLIWPWYIVLDQRIYSENEVKLDLRITSPVPINDLKSLPDLRFLTKKILRTKFVVNHLKQIGKKFASTMWRLPEIAKWFYFTIHPMSFPSILPEFESYATVSKTSIVTFDKKILHLNPDKCKILLSKDVLHNKWNIILNQENKQRSYTVNIGKTSITISGSDYKVTVNGKPTELPLEIGSTTLVGLGRVMKLKDDSLELAVTIDPLNEIFTVGISGWYHGKVRGLFGNSDNEPFNDLMLENGKIVSDNVFAKSYNDNGQSCNIKEQVKEDLKPVKSCPFLRKLVCNFLYKCPVSPLAACFEKVDPSQFLQMCINNPEEFQVDYDPSICNSARQYQSQCVQAGVKISVPYPCQRCDVTSEIPLVVNQSRYMKVDNKASDIVFIVDEGQCLNSLKPKLPKFVTDLEKEMNSKGINPVRFGLVTYVGNQEHSASFHTVGQKMLGTSEEMLRSLKALSTSKGLYKDVIGGITQALEYPFNDHSSKHFVMISCQSINALPASFQTMADKLKQKAIHFSLLTDFTFKLKDNNKVAIFGVDSKYIYTQSSADVDKGSVTRPVNDFLYKIAMQINGIVYDYKYFISNQKLTEKKFSSSLVTQISFRATPAKSVRCTCTGYEEFSCVLIDLHRLFPVKKVN